MPLDATVVLAQLDFTARVGVCSWPRRRKDGHAAAQPRLNSRRPSPRAAARSVQVAEVFGAPRRRNACQGGTSPPKPSNGIRLTGAADEDARIFLRRRARARTLDRIPYARAP